MNKKSKLSTRGMTATALFAALIAVGAFIRIPIPVVPLTLQFLFVNLAGLILGSKYGSLSVLVYIIVGLVGIPVFTGGGGIGYVLYPTFGYLLGFAAGAFASGKIVEILGANSMRPLLLAGFANLLIVYIIGVIYYYLIANYYLKTPIGVGALILHGTILTIPGDFTSCFLSALLAKRLRPVIRAEGF